MENPNLNYNLLIVKKTEKIVTAIYLITQFLKDKEPLKNDLRSQANKLLKFLNSLAYIENKDVFLIYKNALDIISLLISYLTIAKDTNLISRMNSEIVIEALRLLENLLAKKQFYLTEENLLINEEKILSDLLNEKRDSTPNFNTSFDALTGRVSVQNSQFTNHIIVGDNIISQNKEDKKNIKDKIYKGQNENIFIKDKSIKKENFLQMPIKDIVSISKSKADFKLKKEPKNKGRKNTRRGQILALFTKGVEVSINDISKKIIGCSIKTIQRELNELVLENKIEKIGDKRWSKYTLI